MTMNDKRLRIYLHDHLALMTGEVKLAGRCRSSNRRTPLGAFLDRLETETRAQQSIVQDVLHRIGARRGIGSRAKQGAAWLAVMFGGFKLNGSLVRYSDLSRVLELEALTATAQARIALWDNLHAVASRDARLGDITFSFFRDQAQEHLDKLDTHRRFAAAEAFGATVS